MNELVNIGLSYNKDTKAWILKLLYKNIKGNFRYFSMKIDKGSDMVITGVDKRDGFLTPCVVNSFIGAGEALRKDVNET